jgi:hypothetical protein
VGKVVRTQNPQQSLTPKNKRKRKKEPLNRLLDDRKIMIMKIKIKNTAPYKFPIGIIS